MKTFTKLYLLLFFGGFIFCSNGGSPTPPWQKENVSFPMMNQEIRHTMQEHERQKEMKNKQNLNTIVETSNKQFWTKLKTTSKKIQDRLRVVSFAMQGVSTGVQLTRISNRIIENQKLIIYEIESAPYLILAGIPQEVQFVDDLQMIVRLLVGIVVSYGAINQMEKAERKILLDYAIAEAEALETTSVYALLNIRMLKDKINLNKGMLRDYVNKDKEVIQDILNNIKTF